MINQFTGEYRWLSNFWPAKVKYLGVEYPTVEHAYQAAKTEDSAWRENIRQAATPGQAKRLGSQAPMRPEWHNVKLEVMENLVRRKFQHPELKALLLATKNEELVEGNYWGDTFWGVCRGKGENHLGKILMKIRSEL